MSVQKLRSQKERKHFFRNSFRNVLWLIYASLFLNILFIIGIYQVIINREEPDYYATSGIKPPIKLSPMSQPNYSSEALLPPAPEDGSEYADKVVQ